VKHVRHLQMRWTTQMALAMWAAILAAWAMGGGQWVNLLAGIMIGAAVGSTTMLFWLPRRLSIDAYYEGFAAGVAHAQAERAHPVPEWEQ
jgi:hypothetical protein